MRETSRRSSTSRASCPDLTLDDAAGLVMDEVLGPLRAEEMDGVENGGQRAAQLVGQHRQEFVLAAMKIGQAAACSCVIRSRRQRSLMSRMLHWMTLRWSTS